MIKCGLYDPLSLRKGDGIMTIDFINAANAEDVETVEISSPEMAKHVADRLRQQANPAACPFHALGKETVRLTGAIYMPPDLGGAGIIITLGAEGQQEMVEIHTLFQHGPDALPKAGAGFVAGYMEEGKLHAFQVAMQAAPPAPKVDVPGDSPAAN